MSEKFEPEGLWSGKSLKDWEIEAFRFFKLWGPLLLVAGVSGGLGAVFFRLLIQINHSIFFSILGGHGVSVLFLPVIGGLIVGPIIYKWANEAWGHGVPEVMEALRSRGGKIRTRVAIVKILASSVTIGSGGSAGREGPIAQIGASVSSVVGQLFHLDQRSLKLMVMAGASAGISGTFKAPIGGALFGLEVLNGEIRTTDLIVMAISSMVGYIVAVALLGPAPIFFVSGITFKDADMPFYLILGVIGGFVSYLWTRGLYGVEDLFAKFKIQRKWFSPFLGAWVVGAIGLFFPQTLGLGYNIIDQFFSGKLALEYTGSFVLFFFMLFLAKLGTSAFTIGSGGSGGVFSPSLFMGAMIGAIYGIFIDTLFPSISPGFASFALVGMGVIFAGSAKAPLMSTIIVAEMSRNFVLLPGLFIACIASYLISGPGSIYWFKVQRTVGQNIPDKYLKTPEMPAMALMVYKAMKNRDKDKKEKQAQKQQDKQDIEEDTHMGVIPEAPERQENHDQNTNNERSWPDESPDGRSQERENGSERKDR